MLDSSAGTDVRDQRDEECEEGKDQSEVHGMTAARFRG